MSRYDSRPCEHMDCKNFIPSCAKVCRYCRRGVTPTTEVKGSNRFGIPRDIPSEIAKQVRSDCGFGCVVCGELLVHYDHFEPEFKHLEEEHNAQGIALLCPLHHAQRSGKTPVLSRKTMRKLRNEPFCKQQTSSLASNHFFALPGPSGIRLATTSVFKSKTKILVNGKPMIWFEIPENGALFQPIMFGLEIQNEDKTVLLAIEDNILKIIPPNGIDIKCEASTVTIWKDRKIILRMSREESTILNRSLQVELANLLGDHWESISSKISQDDLKVLRIERADIWFNGKHIEIKDDFVKVDGVVRFSGEIIITGSSADAGAEINL